MKINASITSEDVKTAVAEWFKRQQEYEVLKSSDILVFWKGGSVQILHGQIVTQQEYPPERD